MPKSIKLLICVCSFAIIIMDQPIPTVAIDKEFVVSNLKVNQDSHKNETDSSCSVSTHLIVALNFIVLNLDLS